MRVAPVGGQQYGRLALLDVVTKGTAVERLPRCSYRSVEVQTEARCLYFPESREDILASGKLPPVQIKKRGRGFRKWRAALFGVGQRSHV